MSSQTKVGLLFLFAIVSAVVFISFLGNIDLFGDYRRVVVAYNFVGGLEEGSHVRVMGVKAGKVERVEFKPEYKDKQGNEVKLLVHIKILAKAWPAIREDSQFFINMAGIIGEKYLEISPGSMQYPALKEGMVVRGMDPPRVDQLISQGYALAGKILSVVEENESSFTSTIASVSKLVDNLNKILSILDKLSGNLDSKELMAQIKTISKELLTLLKDANQGDIKEVIKDLEKLLSKLDKIDEKEIRQFLQKEGIKARVTL